MKLHVQLVQYVKKKNKTNFPGSVACVVEWKESEPIC